VHRPALSLQEEGTLGAKTQEHLVHPLLGDAVTEWTFVLTADGVVIVDNSNGDVLYSPDTIKGARIFEGQLTGGANEQWDVGGLESGIGDIYNASDTLVLDDPTRNATLIQDQANGSPIQDWLISTSWPDAY
jgi:hypothetical protein